MMGKKENYEIPPETRLDDLIEYIRNRIKELRNEIKDNHFEDCASGHDFETHQNIEFAISVLEDLLK